jgi:hypothetical protein
MEAVSFGAAYQALPPPWFRKCWPTTSQPTPSILTRRCWRWHSIKPAMCSRRMPQVSELQRFRTNSTTIGCKRRGGTALPGFPNVPSRRGQRSAAACFRSAQRPFKSSPSSSVVHSTYEIRQRRVDVVGQIALNLAKIFYRGGFVVDAAFENRQHHQVGISSHPALPHHCLHLHQVVKGTLKLKLSTCSAHQEAPGAFRAPGAAFLITASFHNLLQHCRRAGKKVCVSCVVSGNAARARCQLGGSEGRFMSGRADGAGADDCSSVLEGDRSARIAAKRRSDGCSKRHRLSAV